jgi:hypothetical protein
VHKEGEGTLSLKRVFLATVASRMRKEGLVPSYLEIINEKFMIRH